MDRAHSPTAGTASTPDVRPAAGRGSASAKTTASVSNEHTHAVGSPAGPTGSQLETPDVVVRPGQRAPPPVDASRRARVNALPPEKMQCPVCIDPPQDAFITQCGHTFCYDCISRWLQSSSTCPACEAYVTLNSIQPNYKVDSALRPRKRPRADYATLGGTSSSHVNKAEPQPEPTIPPRGDSTRGAPEPVTNLLADMIPKLRESGDIDQLLAMLEKQKQEIQWNQRQNEDALLLSFLQRAMSQKREKIDQLEDQLRRITSDMSTVTTKLRSRGLPVSPPRDDPRFAERKKRLDAHFPEFETRYFGSGQGSKAGKEGAPLDAFAEDLTKFAKFSGFNCLATLHHSTRSDGSTGTGDGRIVSNIVSSIEFNRDSDRIATAGVMKRIKIFEFSRILCNGTEVHYPIQELVTRAKLSCLSWNPYIRNRLISSDYEGVVTLYDVAACQIINEFEEHERRAWSVDFSSIDPSMFASASDDGRVKVWSTNQSNSVTTIENRANVCCVQFNPSSSYELAFGSADHNVQFYDIRNCREPVWVLPGHAKAVSYARFLDGTLLCSASTDSTLKLWDVRKGENVRTFEGHRNDKNFVGLSVTEDYVACGSENNSLYTYYKALSRPLLKYNFSNAELANAAGEDEGSLFVSSVCWCPQQPQRLLAANSQGTIKVLELVSSHD